MPVLVLLARPVSRSNSPLATSLACLRLWLALQRQRAIVSRRGDPRLMADGAIPDRYRLACEEARRQRESVRHMHWML
ncbi:hypothetical protein BMJ23_09775 [Sinorhizobium medicae]|nr:hypothetical protein BMJ23_09775 [Sinorhizobium medicae]